MKCEICHQNEAETVIYRPKKDGGRPEELYVCKHCAERERAFGQERGIQVAALDSDSIADMPESGMPPGPNPGLPPGIDTLGLPKEVFSKLGRAFDELSKRFDDADFSDGNMETEDGEIRKCPRCGMPSDELRHHALIGCPECYKAHRKLIASLLEQIQGTDAFSGEPFPGAERLHDIELLKRQQIEAIKKEDYRQAMRLHKQIEDLVHSSDDDYSDTARSIDDIDDSPADRDDGLSDWALTPENVSRTVEHFRKSIEQAKAEGNTELADQMSQMLDVLEPIRARLARDSEEPAEETPAGKPKKNERKTVKAKKTAEKTVRKPAKTDKSEQTDAKPAKKPAKKTAKKTAKTTKATKAGEQADTGSAKIQKTATKRKKTAKKPSDKDGEPGK